MQQVLFAFALSLVIEAASPPVGPKVPRLGDRISPQSWVSWGAALGFSRHQPSEL